MEKSVAIRTPAGLARTSGRIIAAGLRQAPGRLGRWPALNPNLYRQQQHLERYVGNMALVGGFVDPETEHSGPSASRRAQAAARVLEDQGVFRPNTSIVGIRPLLPNPAMGSLKREFSWAAELLQEALTMEYGVTTLVESEPAILPPADSKHVVEQSYQVLDQTLYEFEASVDAADVGLRHTHDLGFIAVAIPGYAAQVFGNLRYSHLTKGGVATLREVRQRPEHTEWLPTFRYETADLI